MLTDLNCALFSPYALGKLYTNTLLVIFNNRIRVPRNSSDEDSAGLKVVASVHTPPRSSRSSSNDSNADASARRDSTARRDAAPRCCRLPSVLD